MVACSVKSTFKQNEISRTKKTSKVQTDKLWNFEKFILGLMAATCLYDGVASLLLTTISKHQETDDTSCWSFGRHVVLFLPDNRIITAPQSRVVRDALNISGERWTAGRPVQHSDSSPTTSWCCYRCCVRKIQGLKTWTCYFNFLKQVNI